MRVPPGGTDHGDWKPSVAKVGLRVTTSSRSNQKWWMFNPFSPPGGARKVIPIHRPSKFPQVRHARGHIIRHTVEAQMRLQHVKVLRAAIQEESHFLMFQSEMTLVRIDIKLSKVEALGAKPTPFMSSYRHSVHVLRQCMFNGFNPSISSFCTMPL